MTSRPYILGLTGSIGMGKSTTSRFFAEAGVPVWDADAAVHYLYEGNTAVVQGIAKLVPQAVENQKVNRNILRNAIKEQPKLLQQVESVVHPFVSLGRKIFIDNAATAGQPLVVIDHPLLFETNGAQNCDAVLVVSATPEEQKRRVLGRDGMTEETFAFILSRQMPDAEKRAKADYVLETTTPDAAKTYVRWLIGEITGKPGDA